MNKHTRTHAYVWCVCACVRAAYKFVLANIWTHAKMISHKIILINNSPGTKRLKIYQQKKW